MEQLSEILKFIYCAAMVLLLFNLTIFVHEWGHYLLARWRKLKVEEFSIWFGPAIWQKKIGDVVFSLRSIPLGGYVKLPQLQPDDPIEGKSDTPREELPYAHPRDRLPTLFAGSVFNFLFALVIASVLWLTGIPVPASFVDTTVGYVSPDSPEADAGLRPGDHIVSVNGEPVSNWQQIRIEVALSSSASVKVGIERDGRPESVSLLPGRDNLFGVRELKVIPENVVLVGQVNPGTPAEKAGLQVGDRVVSLDGVPVLCNAQFTKLVAKREDLASSLVVDRDGRKETLSVTPRYDSKTKRPLLGIALSEPEILFRQNPIDQVTGVIYQMAQTINAMFHHKQTGIGVKDLSGPVGIIGMLFNLVGSDIRLALSFLVLLNVNLAILNLLPIPVLDGGHILFTLLEWIRKKPLNYKVMEALQTTFLVLLLGFILYVTFNDGKRWAREKGFLQEQEAVSPSEAPAPAQ